VKRCLARQENLPLRAARARLLEVVQKSFAGFINERVFLRSALFGACDRDCFAFPVHILQT
jgi:hypothetical protein